MPGVAQRAVRPAMGLNLWLPEEVAEEYTPAAQGDADVQKALEFRGLLKQVDDRLDIIWVKPYAPSFPIGGRWYIIRQGTLGAAWSFWIIQSPSGEYAAPEESDLDELRERDAAAHPDVWRRMLKARADEERRREKAKDELHREFREKLDERIRHNHDTQVAVTEEFKDQIDAATS